MSKKILIVDDEQDWAEMIKTRLESNGFTVITATDGVEGLVVAKEEKPDLIILDILMPSLDGVSFIKEIGRAEEVKDTKVVVVSAKPDLKEILAEEGIVDYLLKPVDPEEFMKLINDSVSDDSAAEAN